MSAKRIAAHTVNWSVFGPRVPKQEIAKYNAFKSKSDGYVVKVASLPESIPQINWAQYESKVAVPGLVENFKKAYAGVTVPYPTDKYSTAIDTEAADTDKEMKEFISARQGEIAAMEADLGRLNTMPPPSEMTIEEFYEAFPDRAIDPFDKPTVWPHGEEYQPEYVERMFKEGHFTCHDH